MQIGEEQEPIIVEPIEDPFERPAPREKPAPVEAPEREKVGV